MKRLLQMVFPVRLCHWLTGHACTLEIRRIGTTIYPYWYVGCLCGAAGGDSPHGADRFWASYRMWRAADREYRWAMRGKR